MIPMGERVRHASDQAGDQASPMLMDIHLMAATEACQALAALGEDEFAGPNVAEAKSRIRTILRLLITGER